ncbi:SAV_2336 N-terminal domain-related protein [Streptomyces sp. NPDC059441]|uniref:SAV_2336 N-terminal domain-related protein n=1 Tax=Streptomyces sp. NPDC059441 TaxID=3346829 RepID=UPI003683257A
MAEDAAALLARLARAGGGDIDVKELLDAVLLASARAHSDKGHGSPSPHTADAAARLEEQGQADTAAPTEGTRARGSGDATDTAHEPVASVWLEDEAGARTVPGRRVNIGRATALPNALDIGRALRPLRRPWLSGVRRRLDIDATVEHYTRTGMLVPRLTPEPEPWLEVIVVLDRGTAMAVWDETVRALTKTLRALAAFRDVRVWHLDHPPGDTPVLHDHHGSALPMHPDAAHHTQPARRLLLVVTDCAAPAWRQDALWRTLHTWGRTAPVALINPLPKRLWQRSGLDLPHTTAAATVPASPGSLLSYRRPRLLRETQDTKPWQALPVLQFDPAQILAWARTLMRTDPSGCEAVLVPATGRPPLRRQHPGPVVLPDVAPTDDQVRAHAEAFTDDRESSAVRLAIAASPLDSFTIPVLDVLRERLLPDATLADTSEFLTAGLLTATRRTSADTIYYFHPAAAAHLATLLTRDQLWDTHFALSDHLAAHLQAPHGIPVTLHSPHADDTVPTGIRPIAYAAATTARLLGVEPTDHLPETGRRRAAERPAGPSSKPQHGTAPTTPRMPENSHQATKLELVRPLTPAPRTDPDTPPAGLLLPPARGGPTPGAPLDKEGRRTLIEALLRSPLGRTPDTYALWLDTVRLLIRPVELSPSRDDGPLRNRIISVINFAMSQRTPQVMSALADALEELGNEPAIADVRQLVDRAVDAWNHETLTETETASGSGSGQDRQRARVNDDALELGEARYELVISVDTRGPDAYDDVDAQRMRARLYRVLETAFTRAMVARDALHMEDRGDGVLLTVAGRVSASRLLGLWLVEVHETLRDENRVLRVPARLRIGMHVGPVRHDHRGISGRAVDLACRLADSAVARRLLDAEGANLVLVTSQSLYEDVVRTGGRFIEPAHYSSARLRLKEGEVTAWFHLPGRPAPAIPDATPPSTSGVTPTGSPTTVRGGTRAGRQRFDDVQLDLIARIVRVLEEPAGGLLEPGGRYLWRRFIEEAVHGLPQEFSVPHHEFLNVVSTCARQDGALEELARATALVAPALGRNLQPLLDEWRAHDFYAGRDWGLLRRQLQIRLPELATLVSRSTGGRVALPSYCETAWQAFVYLTDVNSPVGHLPPSMVLLEHLAHCPELAPAMDEMRAWNDHFAAEWGLSDGVGGSEGLWALRRRLELKRRS